LLDPRGQILRTGPRLLDSPPAILTEVPMRRRGRRFAHQPRYTSGHASI